MIGRRHHALLLLGALAVACGDDPANVEVPAAAPERAPEEGATPAAAVQPDDELEDIDAHQYWLLRALGMVKAEREMASGIAVTIESDEGTQRTVRIAREVLQDTRSRDHAYPQAVRMLGRMLGGPDESRRRRAEERIEELTKTTRSGGVGPKSPWLRWYREFGDYLRYNPDLDRVEVDEERKQSGRAAAVDGLSLKVVGDRDRVKRGQPIKCTIVLSLEAGAPPRWVNRRLRLPDELELWLELEEEQQTIAVELVVPAPAEALAADDFVQLSGTQSARTTIDLTALVEGDLAPGTYALSATYRNDVSGAELGVGDSTVWIGQLTSSRHRFRVVPW